MSTMEHDQGKSEADIGKPVPTHSEHAVYTPNTELIEAAMARSDEEATLPRKELFKRYAPAVVFSMLLSLALVMEGMDTGLINNFFAQPAFRRKFGWPDQNGKLQVSATWQGAVGAANNCGQIIGLLLNGALQSRYGSRKVYMVSALLVWYNIGTRLTGDSLGKHGLLGMHDFHSILCCRHQDASCRKPVLWYTLGLLPVSVLRGNS